jgi:hypothetical protein
MNLEDLKESSRGLLQGGLLSLHLPEGQWEIRIR